MSWLESRREFAESLEEFLELHRTYVQSLEDFGNHLRQVEVPPPSKHSSSKTLQAVLKKVSPCPELEAWMEGRIPTAKAIPSLSDRLTDDVRALQTAAEAMRRHFCAWEATLEQTAARGVEALSGPPCGSPDRAPSGNDVAPPSPPPGEIEKDLARMACVLDGCAEETRLLAAVHDEVGLESDADALSAWSMLLALEPYVVQSLVEDALRWADGDEGVAAAPS